MSGHYPSPTFQDITVLGTASGTFPNTDAATTVQSSIALAGTSKTGVLIPYYIYPSDPFLNATTLRFYDLLRRYHDVPVIVVVNSANGAGVYDAVWDYFIKRVRATGALVAGYVDTQFAGRSDLSPLASGETPRTMANMQADILAWNQIYHVDGIFFDQMQNAASGIAGTPGYTNYVQLYADLYTYARANGYGFVIGNPGADQIQSFYDTATADVIVIHEDTPVSTVAAKLAPVSAGGHLDYSYTLNSILLYGQSSIDGASPTTTVNAALIRQWRRYCKWIYVNDDTLPNPWDTLPSYLEQLFAVLQDTDVPGAGLTPLTYAASITWDAYETRFAKVTLTGNASMATPTNLMPGNEYVLIVTQDATGGRTLNFSSAYKFVSTVSLPLTATANQKQVIRFVYDGVNMLATSYTVYS